MWAPWSMLHRRHGDQASPAWTNSTVPPFAFSAFTTAASRAMPPRPSSSDIW
jgi:hypothetical protein